MALYIRKLCPGIAIHPNLTFSSCKISGCVLRSSSELLETIRWGVFSATILRAVSSHHHVYKLHRGRIGCTDTARHCKLLPYDVSGAGKESMLQLRLAAPAQLSAPVDGPLVCLSDLYARDPLALLLHSHVQVYASNGISSLSLIRTYSAPAALLNAATCNNSAKAVFYASTSGPCSNSGGSDDTGFIMNTSLPGSLCAIVPTRHSSPSLLCQSEALQLSLVSRTGTAETTNKKCGGDGSHPPGLPSPSQLQRVFDSLVESVPLMFKESMEYSIYDKNIIFENRIRGTTTIGIGWYVSQMMMLKMLGRLKFAYIVCDILKITQHPEEGTIKVRWRIRGIKSKNALLGFMKARKWGVSHLSPDDTNNWYDGFSTFTVNSAGQVSRHVADNMMPDDEKLSVRNKPGLAATLGVVLGLAPKPEHGSAMEGLADCF